MQVVIMATSQVVLYQKKSLDFSSELLLPIKRTIPVSCSFPSSLLISRHNRGDKKSRASNGFFCQRQVSDDFPAKNESCSSEVLVDALYSNVKKMENSTATTSIFGATAPPKGLGIVDFMKGKNFFITGATGFVAKVLIEKILSMQTEVGKLFLLIRADDSASAIKRLRNEVFYTELFKGLREKYGNEFEKFMLKRLVPVAGDMTQHALGLDEEMADRIIKEVDIIVSSAANTTFDERYDVALETNTKGVYRLLEFGKCCKKVQLFMHLSTAYVNGQKQGRALEEPFQMGYNIAKEKAESTSVPLDIEAEFDLAKKALEGFEEEFLNLQNYKSNSSLDSRMKIDQSMKDLGIERARAYGWQDTYGFTKAMAEMLLGHCREHLPVVIVRPSVIESTHSRPFPGWIEGHRMLDPIFTHYGKGQLSCLLADPDSPLDLVPVDMVVNATLAAIAKHAGKPGLKIYHAASSASNRITMHEIMKIIFEHFRFNPYFDKKGKSTGLLEEITFIPTMEDFCVQAALGIPETMSQRQKIISMKSIEQFKYMAKIYQPYFFYKAIFDSSNLEELFQELSAEEKENFGFDLKNIKWKNYLGNSHMHGLRQHVLKGRGSGTRRVNISCQ